MGDEPNGPAASLKHEREGLDLVLCGEMLRRDLDPQIPGQRAELSFGRLVQSSLSSEGVNPVDCPTAGAQVDLGGKAAGPVESGPES
jgi:hypothetical protein